MMTHAAKWQPNRAGLLNFWYYDDEELRFADGKLLLRGTNGSGKSVTMQSLIPLLLDGKKSPERLDPFGSRARRIEDYLLGEKELVDRDERTGYLYLEFRRKGTNQYLTTGIGLQAKRGASVKFWGFAILDNRRIGRDLFLYKTEYNAQTGEEEKIPLSRRELETRLESGGTVVSTQGEYMELVNRHVFGFEAIEAYEELIKLLIQLRSPKLSKDFKPTVIYEILDGSLPSLSDDELRPLSDTIESMDQIKQQLDQLLRQQASLRKVCQQYTTYNQVVLADKAQGLLQAHRREHELQESVKSLQKSLVSLAEQKADLENQLAEVKRERKVLEDEERQLRDHDVFREEEEKKQLEDQLVAARRKLNDQQKALLEYQKIERDQTQRLDDIQVKQAQLRRELHEHLESAEYESDEAGFGQQHRLCSQGLTTDLEAEFDFDLWRHQAESYRQQLEDVLRVIRAENRSKERYQEADHDLGEARQKLDELTRDQNKWELVFAEEKDRWLTAFHQWSKDNEELRLSDDEVRITAQRAVDMYGQYQFDEVRQETQQAFNRWHAALQKQLAENSQLIRQQEQLADEKQRELTAWKQKHDPEPERHPATAAARKRLHEAGIPFVPLYSAVEFRPEVSAEIRNRIEAAVMQMGVLDALVIPEKNQGKALECDKVLRPQPKLLVHTLGEFLEPTPTGGISAEEIDNVLRSIVVDTQADGTALVPETGEFRIGLLEGQTPGQEQSVFIGKEARRQYRLREIARLESELAEIQTAANALWEEGQRLTERVEMLKREHEAFPAANDVREAHLTVEKVRQQVDTQQGEVERINRKLKDAFNQWQIQLKQLRAAAQDLAIELTERAYETARGFIQEYIQSLHKVQLRQRDLVNSRDAKAMCQEQLEMVIGRVDEAKGEVNMLTDREKTLRMQLDALERRLMDLGIGELRRRIKEVLIRLEEIPGEVETTARKVQQTEDRIEQAKADAASTAKALFRAQRLTGVWQEVFAADVRLVSGFGAVEPILEVELPHDSGAVKQAEAVWHRYGHLLSDSSPDRNKVMERLNRVFYEEGGTLVEYRLAQEYALEQERLPDLGGDEAAQEQGSQLRQRSRRIQLLMDHRGKRVSPYAVLTDMDKDIQLQERILDDKDRELYEEIIMHSVGGIIRGRIYRAEQWVKQINQLMKERNSSSGLTFSLRWKARTAEHDDEMDTKELVDLLRTDPRLLKEEDMHRVTKHFRSKVSRAKQLVQENGYADTLHRTIRDMLDYRQWFSFTLYFQRAGQPVRELTNNQFYKFSGGEKAMAMYIPLFSAVYSRYMEARDDAPFIISLDEAFAGVDENNIRDMFDLVEKLGFDYIMNSQALWGDYDTVSSLSIHELIRPQNAPFVTVVRYYWTGEVKQLVTEAKDYEFSHTG